MKLAVEGYICAALFCNIFYIIPSDYADDQSIEVPGTVTSTELQFKKHDNPNWPAVPKKTVSTYNRVCHHCYCFLLSIVLLNGMSVLPHSFESIAYGINKKKSMKGATNVGANIAKRNNYTLIQEKAKYNMKMLHKASLSGKLFIIFSHLKCYVIIQNHKHYVMWHLFSSASPSARFWEFHNDGNSFNKFNLNSQYCNIIKTFFQNCFSFKNSCAVGHPNEVVVPSGKTVLINDFIAMFYGTYGTFVRATVLA